MKLLNSFQQNKIHYKNYLLLLVIALLAYWPLTFGVFSVKNDAIHYFLPYRFQISETIRNGEWPFWNPYVYLGYPMQGDMQSGAWNPIVWIFSLIGRYDLTLFHYENLLYIFLGAVGMYKLTNRLVEHSQTALLIAASYMLSGFMLSGQLINWLAAAAFLPFVIHYYLQTLRSASYGNAIKTGVALFLFFTASYPSFVIITGYLLLSLLIITIIHRYRNKEANIISWKIFILQQLLIAMVFTGLALPAIVSYIDLLPYYHRGGGTSYQDSIANSFEGQHLLSLLFPSSIKVNDFVSSTDVTCRNMYIGLFAIIILAVFPPKLNRRNILLICLAIFSLLFSLGDVTPVRKICFNIVPLMDTFRHPSQMRLYFIFAMLLLVAPGLKRLLSTDLATTDLSKLKKLTWGITAAISVITLIAIFKSGVFRQISGFQLTQLRNFIKNIFDSIKLSDAIAVNGLIQILFLIAFLLLLRKPFINKRIFVFLWIANLFIIAQLVLPATFVSKISPKEINRFIHTSPNGFPAKGLEKTIGENSKDALAHFDKFGLAYFYNKKIGISHITNSPSFLTKQDELIENSFLYHYVSSLPVVYMADSLVQLKDSASLDLVGNCHYAFIDSLLDVKSRCSTGDTVIIKQITASSFKIETQNKLAGFLVLTQNYHHHWNASVNGKETFINKTNISFMGIQVPAGKHTIVFRFVPGNTIKALWMMLATLILLFMIGIVSLIRQSRITSQ